MSATSWPGTVTGWLARGQPELKAPGIRWRLSFGREAVLVVVGVKNQCEAPLLDVVEAGDAPLIGPHNDVVEVPAFEQVEIIGLNSEFEFHHLADVSTSTATRGPSTLRSRAFTGWVMKWREF